MDHLLYAIFAVVAISISSLIGVFTLSLKERTLDRILFVLLSFSAGSILGAALLDLLPEAAELAGEAVMFPAYVTFGFLGFFFLERFIYWFHGHVHGHEPKSEVDGRISIQRFVYLNLIGDGIHNFLDGMVIAAAFFVGIPVGLTTTIAVAFHELPQEIGDFGVLVYGGFTRNKALLFNFISALTAVAGAILSTIFSGYTEKFASLLIAFAAGGFIYIAASELIPEIQKEKEFAKSIVQFLLFIFGIILIWCLGFIFPE